VAAYFLDTSALVKRYVAELGTAWIRQLTDPTEKNEVFVAKISGAEGTAALVRQDPMLPNLSGLLADFKFDFQKQYRRLALTNAVIVRAMRLAESYRLRGYDAVQLATAVELHTARATAGLPPAVFVSADVELNGAAKTESLVVDDPNAHP